MITRIWDCWQLPLEAAEALLAEAYYVCRDSQYALDALWHTPLVTGEDEWIFPSFAVQRERLETEVEAEAEEVERLPEDVEAGQIWPDQLAKVGLGTRGMLGFVFIRGNLACVVMDGAIYPLEAEPASA